ncbi:hypothetical protein BH10ACI4_BH10ACI4_17410 [soil metagenome]
MNLSRVQMAVRRALRPFANLVLVAWMTCGGTTLVAQTIVGTWQGTLPVAKDPRVVLKITKADDGSLRGGVSWLEPVTSGLPFSSVTFVAPELNVSVDAASITYKGQMNADGSSLVGVWAQGKQTYPLTFFLATPETRWKNGGAGGIAPMAATADPTFEVATIKPSAPDAKSRFFALESRHFAARNSTVSELIRFAYHLRPRQIEGGPSWMDEAKFDIAAEPDTEGMPSEAQDRLMLRKLLADRFQLQVHTVQKVFPVYALTVENGPPKISPSDPSVNSRLRILTKPKGDGDMLVQFVYNTMPDFSDLLMNFIRDRHIVDETAIPGVFDFAVSVPISALQSTDENETANAVMRAVQSIGFKLSPKKTPIDVLEIDHLEKPSAN